MKILIVVASILFCVLIYENLATPQERIDHQPEISYSIDDPQFLRSLGHLLGPPIVGGNKIQTFYNGDEIFPAMLSAIRSAKKSITFESYIYLSGEVAHQFVEALVERASAGVQVHVLIDWVGSQSIKDKYLKEMKAAKIELEFYRPLRWFNLSRMNHRTHRKILVIDGQVGFTGGVGISNDWTGNGQDPEKWRDTQFMIEGPAVLYLQSAFMDNWLKVRPEVHHDSYYFPDVPNKGSTFAQVFISSPTEGNGSMRLMYLMVLAAAKKNIRLSMAYFVPDELAIKELIRARQRGVTIEIIVPGPFTDSHIVSQSSKSLWGDLLKSGVKIYRYQVAKYHCKVLIADDVFVSVGSTNFDDRSFRLNDEANLNIFDPVFAAHEVATFEKDKTLSKLYTLENWENRPFAEKALDQISTMFRSQL